MTRSSILSGRHSYPSPDGRHIVRVVDNCQACLNYININSLFCSLYPSWRNDTLRFRSFQLPVNLGMIGNGVPIGSPFSFPISQAIGLGLGTEALQTAKSIYMERKSLAVLLEELNKSKLAGPFLRREITLPRWMARPIQELVNRIEEPLVEKISELTSLWEALHSSKV